ncbi:MAG: AMP-binding protein [bacterium]|nr:AMP-binding protein [bacterium]
MSGRPTYEELLQDFDWSMSAHELGYREGEPLNIGWYCSDRICELGKADKPALLWEDIQGRERTYTFDDLRVLSNTFAKHFQDLGLEPGDRICLLMDRVPEFYMAFLGALKLGAIVQPLFSAYGDESLRNRFNHAGTAAIVTQRKFIRKVHRVIEDLPDLRHVMVVDAYPGWHARGRISPLALDDLPRVEEFDVFPSTPETPSVLHYTSGTSGNPEGAQHVHGSLISQYITAKWVLDLHQDDIYWCNADPGCVTGASYGIIGPWANGITQVALDASFDAPSWYRFIQKYKVTVWYTVPTVLRLLKRDGAGLTRRFDLSSLRHVCSVGEPLSPDAVAWAQSTYGRPVHDTYWQTETGCMVITNFPGMKIKPGSMGRPFPGITAAVVDPETGEEVPRGEVGVIALRPGWPSQIRTYWNNEAGFQAKHLNGWYICIDRARIDEDGYFWYLGRDDDVINTGGHLVGPFEVESALLEHPAVAESAAVATPCPMNMEVVKAFVALNPGFDPTKELELDIMIYLRKKLSPLAMPQVIEFIAELPKDSSGRIMRRTLREREFGDLGDEPTDLGK